MTTKKKHRWAILPPAGAGEAATPHTVPPDVLSPDTVSPDALSPDDVTQTRRRLPHEPGKLEDRAVSRRRARTEPELPGLDALAQQVAPSAIRSRDPARKEEVETLAPANLSSSSREAATVPPDGSPTLASPAESPEGAGPVAVPTIIDLTSPADDQQVTIVERSAGETLPSPSRRDDER